MKTHRLPCILSQGQFKAWLAYDPSCLPLAYFNALLSISSEMSFIVQLLIGFDARPWETLRTFPHPPLSLLPN